MKKGFTLIELLVVLAIFSVLAVVSSTILVSFFRSENKIVATNNVRQFGNSLIDTFERDVRNSQDVSVDPTFCAGIPSCVVLTDKSSGSRIIWRCEAGTPNILTRQKVVAGIQEPEIEFTDTTVNGTTLSNTSACAGVFTIAVTGPPSLVELVFDLQNGTGQSRVVVPFRTSVSNRQY